jgi:membrane-associated protease RseP (regulator of RpoE activity)
VSAVGILIFVGAVFFAIALHEFGHFATAKAFGMKVERFFIGFGPPLWSVRKGETEYGIATLPFGGYVRIAGMNPYEEIHPEDRNRVFKSKPGWQQFIVLVAGSFSHFLVAFLLAAALLGFVGLPRPTTSIESVQAALADGTRTPAAKAGFRPGDTVVRVDGTIVTEWNQARDLIRAAPGRVLHFVVLRSGREVQLDAQLASTNPEKEKVGFLGVSTRTVTKTYGAGSFAESAKILGGTSWDSLKALGSLVSPRTVGRLFSQLTGSAKRTLEDPASIVGVTRAAGDFAGRGRFADLFFLIVGFNIFVGVANMIPLPPLDGGHVAVLGYETVRRRRVDMRKLMPVSVAVVAVLVTLFVLSLYLDIVKPLPTLPG